jgi:hypothetical protein
MLFPLGLLSQGGRAALSAWYSVFGDANAQTTTGKSLSFDPSFNGYAGGRTEAGSFPAFIFSFSATGSLLWQRAWNNISSGNVSLSADATGVYLTSGANGSAPNYGEILIRYNSSGIIQWQRVYDINAGGPRDTSVVRTDSSSNVYIAGSYNFSGGNPGAAVTKINSSGVVQWCRMLSLNTVVGEAGDIAIDSSANVFLAGTIRSAGSDIPVLAKYDSSGTLQWQKTLSGVSGLYYRGIKIDSSGNLIVVGYVGANAFVAKYNSSGSLTWQRTLTGATIYAELHSVDVDNAGNIYAAGRYRNGTSTGDAFVVSYNTSGTLLWQRSWGNNAVNESRATIVLDAGSGFYLGFTSPAVNAGDYVTTLLPRDGSKTGTYGSFVYAATTLTASTPTYTDTAGSFSASTPSITTTTSTITDSATSYTFTKTSI